MATVKVVDLINRARVVLQETTDPGVRWPVLELQDWLNDAYREIILQRPDANSQSANFNCASGTRQNLVGQFPSALRLMDVVRNQHSRAVRLIDRAILDDQRRGWHGEAATTHIEHYMFDEKLPREFLVYPPATSSATLEIVFSSVPTNHTLSEAQLINRGTSDVIKIVDSYANAILDYMLYRAYSKDAEYASNAKRAAAHYTAMQSSLGIKSASDKATEPDAPPATTIR